MGKICQMLGRWKLLHLVLQTTQPILQLYTQILHVSKSLPMWFLSLPPSHNNSSIFVGSSMYFSTTTSHDKELVHLRILYIIGFLYPSFERDSSLFQLTNQTLRHGILRSTIDYNGELKKHYCKIWIFKLCQHVFPRFNNFILNLGSWHLFVSQQNVPLHIWQLLLMFRRPHINNLVM